MPDQVDHRVTMSFHPETFVNLDGYGEDSAKFIGDAVSTFNDCYRTLGKLHDARDAADRNPTWTPEQAILHVSKVAYKEQERLCRKLDAARVNTTKALEHTERELSVPIASKATLAVAQEIRSHAKSLDGKQMDFLRERIMAGDELTVSALLGAPSYLSGLTDDAQAVFTRMWHEQQNPALAQRVRLLRATVEKLERDEPLILIETQRAIGARAGTVRGIDAANERALAALKIEPVA